MCPDCSCCRQEVRTTPQGTIFTPDQQRELWLLSASGIFFAAVLFGEETLTAWFGRQALYLLYALPYLVCALPVFAQAWKRVIRTDLFNEFTLMSVASMAAIFLGHLSEAVGVMLFYRAGEFLQELALERSRGSIRALLANKPVTATIIDPDGTLRILPVEDVVPGGIILVRAGEKIPLDGVVMEGHSQVDVSPLTGESLPQDAEPGTEAAAGCVNISGVLRLKTIRPFADTHMAKILDMVEKAVGRKSPTERFLTRFARYYTPAVTGAAILTAILPPLLTGAEWNAWVYRALVLLVISCPCALLISIPLGYFGGIGAASRQGILVKGGSVLDAVLRTKTVIFDKTGTLSQGVFSVRQIRPVPSCSRETLIQSAVLAERHSNHPLARAILREAETLLPPWSEVPDPREAQETAGQGMEAVAQGIRYLAGNARFLRGCGIAVPEVPEGGCLVHVAAGGEYLGYFVLEDTLKPEAAGAVAALKKRGLKTILLSGDRREAVSEAAASLGLDAFRAELLPEEKVMALESFADPQSTVFVGDGINDAPALVTAGVGIAMGGLGAEAAAEAADAIILNDSPAKVEELYRIAGRTRLVVWQNIILALGVKTLVMGLGIAGLSDLWEAVFADVGVALLAVLNALRVMKP